MDNPWPNYELFQEGHYSSSSAARVRCPAEDIVNPLNVFRIIANSELRKASEYYEAVQVKPQHVSLKLRISKFKRSFMNDVIKFILETLEGIHIICDYWGGCHQIETK